MGKTASFGFQEATISDPEAKRLLDRCKEFKEGLFSGSCAFVVLDCETTGLSAMRDFPYELAALFAVADDSGVKVEHAFHTYIDWTRDNVADPADFNARLTASTLAMQEKFPDVKRPTLPQLQLIGKHPYEALSAFKGLVETFFNHYSATHKVFTCGHNIFNFDANVLHHNYTKIRLQSPTSSQLLDTGLLVKAAQMNPTAVPSPSYGPIDWILEVGKVRAKGLFWNLNEFCTQKFNLDALLPAYIREAPHTALTDAWKVLTLFRLFHQPGKFTK